MTVDSCGAFRFFAITTFDCFCLLRTCAGVMMCICVRVFPFYHVYYLQSFLRFYIFKLPLYVSFYVLTCVALLNIIIDTSTL